MLVIATSDSLLPGFVVIHPNYHNTISLKWAEAKFIKTTKI